MREVSFLPIINYLHRKHLARYIDHDFWGGNYGASIRGEAGRFAGHRSAGIASSGPGCGSWLCRLFALWPHTSHFMPLSLCFPVYKMGLIMGYLRSLWWRWNRILWRSLSCYNHSEIVPVYYSWQGGMVLVTNDQGCGPYKRSWWLWSFQFE